MTAFICHTYFRARKQERLGMMITFKYSLRKSEWTAGPYYVIYLHLLSCFLWYLIRYLKWYFKKKKKKCQRSPNNACVTRKQRHWILCWGLNTALPCFGSLPYVVKGSLHMALIYEAVFKGLTCQVKFVDSHSHAWSWCEGQRRPHSPPGTPPS